jgi:hypothetical protein
MGVILMTSLLADVSRHLIEKCAILLEPKRKVLQ